MSEQEKPIRELPALRQEIDAVDAELLGLLNRRAGLSLEVGRLKAARPGMPIFDPRREKELLDSLVARNQGPLQESHIRAVWGEILSSSCSLQQPQAAAFLGPEGTFSHIAGQDFLGKGTRFVPCRDFTEIFRQVQDGHTDWGIIPLENALQGCVVQSFDLFARHEVNIHAEFYSRITHSLLSRETSLQSISKVYSHPQALGQCAEWLRAHLPHADLRAVGSTAAAARLAAEEDGAAAVAHGRLAEMFHLGVLASGIEDAPGNWTRFVLISAKREVLPLKNGHDVWRSSLLFTLRNVPGALSNILGKLAVRGVNMCSLTSRPLRGADWGHVFFADVDSDMSAPENQALVEELRQACVTFRILGSYPAGRMPLADEA